MKKVLQLNSKVSRVFYRPNDPVLVMIGTDDLIEEGFIDFPSD